jgi:hypothetical protein
MQFNWRRISPHELPCHFHGFYTFEGNYLAHKSNFRSNYEYTSDIFLATLPISDYQAGLIQYPYQKKLHQSAGKRFQYWPEYNPYGLMAILHQAHFMHPLQLSIVQGTLEAWQVLLHEAIAIKRSSYPLIEQSHFHIVRNILINK